MRTRNMIVAACVRIVGSTAKSLQNPAVLRRSPGTAFVPQRPKLALQASQFRDALFHVTDMCIQKRVAGMLLPIASKVPARPAGF
jgi:hypothetical protein